MPDIGKLIIKLIDRTEWEIQKQILMKNDVLYTSLYTIHQICIYIKYVLYNKWCLNN